MPCCVVLCCVIVGVLCVILLSCFVCWLSVVVLRCVVLCFVAVWCCDVLCYCCFVLCCCGNICVVLEYGVLSCYVLSCVFWCVGVVLRFVCYVDVFSCGVLLI